MKGLQENKTSFWLGILCLSALVFSGLIKRYTNSQTNSEISKNGNLTVGKVYDYVYYDNAPTYSYYYFIDNIKYKNEFISDEGFGENAIGHFYEVKCLKSNPSKSILFFEQEVNDPNAILNSGFELVKSSYFDANKNQYFKDSIINYR